jgi:hypothetical protein
MTTATIQTVSTTEICKLIGFNVSISFIKSMGVEPCYETGVGVYWSKVDVPVICLAMAQHLLSVAKKEIT